MKIIVLGMDNTGKTTLCKNLSKELNFKIINSLSIKTDKKEIEEFLINNLKSEDNLIFERFSYFDEMIYGKVLRGKSKFKFMNDNITKTLKEIRPIIIYCRPKEEVILNWKEREQMEGIIDNSKILIKEWDALIERILRRGCYKKLIYWNYTKDEFETLIDMIKQ